MNHHIIMLSWWAVSVFLPPSLPQEVLIKAFNMGESTLGDWWGDTVQGVSNTCWARTCISELPKSLGILFGRQPTNDLISSWPPLAAGPGAQCLLLATSGSRARCTMGLGWGRDARASDVGTLCFKLAQMMGPPKRKESGGRKEKKRNSMAMLMFFIPSGWLARWPNTDH